MNKNINRIIPIKSEYDSLIEEIQSLRMEIVRLTALRDDLLLRICPALRAAYEEKIGSIERKISWRSWKKGAGSYFCMRRITVLIKKR